MEKNEKNPRAFERVGSILERGRFGKTDTPLLWVEASGIPDVARLLREDPDLSLDWLENLSIMQVDRILVASWFLRSRKTSSRLVLRSTVVPSGPEEEVDLPSTEAVWPEARRMERESSELFGIRFGGQPIPHAILPDGLSGFPLRKSFEMRNSIARDPGLGNFIGTA